MSTITTTVTRDITIGSGGYTSPLTITSAGTVVTDGNGADVYSNSADTVVGSAA